MRLNLHLALNQTSIGQTSTLVARTLFDRIKSGKAADEDYSLTPIGEVNLFAQDVSQDFSDWVFKKISKSLSTHNRKTPTFKLWHLTDSLHSFSEKQTLLTFYELDSPTDSEINIAKNNNTLFSSNYTVELFKNKGVNSAFIPLPFDDYNFYKVKERPFGDRIVFNICGKLEHRKNHAKAIQAWVRKFKNDKRFHLQCAVYNPFLRPEDNSAMIANIMQGQRYFNVTFFQFFEKNSTYNKFLNSADIVIGASGGEGWGLPEFTSVCLGKHAIIMDAHAYKDWANEKNSVLLKPSGKVPAYDNIFFKQGTPFNQGDIFTFDDDEFIFSCETAIKRFTENPNNSAGETLKMNFAKEKFLDNIITYAS
jgi:hypothetical protein